MIRLFWILLTLLLLLPYQKVYSQTHPELNKKWSKEFVAAIKDYQSFNIEASLLRLGKLIDKNPQFAAAYLLKAQCHQDRNEDSTAIIAYQQALALGHSSRLSILVELIQLQFNEGRYKEALLYFNKERKELDSIRNIYPGFDRTIKSLDFATQQLLAHSSDLYPRRLLGMDDNQAQYFPALTTSGLKLVFTQINKPVPGSDIPDENLYEGNFIDGTVSDIALLPDPVNSISNDGTQALRQDGKVMIFTSCSRSDSKGGCDLYWVEKHRDRWLPPKNMGYPVNTRYWESSPSLSPNGKRLIFASNRPGGFGGMDLWFSTMDPSGNWSEPQNLGSSINTSEDEIAPYQHIDGYSFFYSSNGRIGMGGLDLFYAEITASGIEHSKNLGYPINSNKNEFGISLPGSGDYILFSSDKEDELRKIYTYEKPEQLMVKSLKSVIGVVLDSLTLRPLKAKVQVYRQLGELMQEVESEENEGQFLISLPKEIGFSMVVNHPGYFYYSREISQSDIASDSSTPEIRILLQPLQKGESIILHQIYFDFDSAVLTASSSGEIVQMVELMQTNKELNIELSGHTDSVGDFQYNQRLSLARAKAIKSRLVEAGISPSRIDCKGYGDTKPIADNTDELGRKKNRRTEMLIK